jgi:hypothetical protein
MEHSMLTDEAYYSTVAAWLDVPDLARTDASCRLLCGLNAKACGPWQTLGDAAFCGMELDAGGGWMALAGSFGGWKTHYKVFHSLIRTFRHPFMGSEIFAVDHPGEEAFFRCRLLPDDLYGSVNDGVYFEVEVLQNTHAVTLKVTDSLWPPTEVTFNPAYGAVVHSRAYGERTYIRLLPAAPPRHCFEGTMGLYLQNGQVAFFRRTSPFFAYPMNHAWETTGFCTVLESTPVQRLSLCIVFHDEGRVHVRNPKIGRSPPIPPQVVIDDNADNWYHLTARYAVELLAE